MVVADNSRLVFSLRAPFANQSISALKAWETLFCELYQKDSFPQINIEKFRIIQGYRLYSALTSRRTYRTRYQLPLSYFLVSSLFSAWITSLKGQSSKGTWERVIYYPFWINCKLCLEETDKMKVSRMCRRLYYLTRGKTAVNFTKNVQRPDVVTMHEKARKE